MAGGTHGADRDLLSAQLFSGVEPRRVTQRRSQTKSYNGGSSKNQTWSYPIRCARFAQRSKTATTRPELLPAKRCQLCGLSPAVMGRINNRCGTMAARKANACQALPPQLSL